MKKSRNLLQQIRERALVFDGAMGTMIYQRGVFLNACYDELRRRKRHPTTPLEPEDQDGDEMDSPRWLADPNLTPDQQAEADELEHAIQHCLDHLPDEFRSVVVLADIQGLDYAEVATALHAPLGTIKSRLARARLRLRECLQGFVELLPAAFRLQEERS